MDSQIILDKPSWWVFNLLTLNTEEQMKKPNEYTSQERREMFASLTKAVLATMKPNCGRFSGQQVAYAKGRAWQQMQKAGF